MYGFPECPTLRPLPNLTPLLFLVVILSFFFLKSLQLLIYISCADGDGI